MKSYYEQRRERLSESIFDYLSDENTTPDELLNDLFKEVKETFDYYDKYASKCKKVLDILTDNNIQETDNPRDWEDFWSSFESEKNFKNTQFDALSCYDTHTENEKLNDTSIRE